MRRAERRNVCFHGIGFPGRTIDDDEARYWVSRDAYLRILDELATWPATTISFDDGNASDVEIGLPALAERGLSATFFVLAGRLDTSGSLSTDEVAALWQAGMRVGSHGMNHVSWRAMPPAVRQRELVEARATLAWLRRLDYRAVHTSDRRPAVTGAWLQPRFSVTADDTPETLVRAALAPRPAPERAMLELKGLVKRWR
jgi:hypothetical protein